MTDDDGLDWSKWSEFFDETAVFMSTKVIEAMIDELKEELEERQK